MKRDVPAFGGRVDPEQDVKTQAVHPEPLGRLQVVAGAGDTQVRRRRRFHSPIIAGVVA